MGRVISVRVVLLGVLGLFAAVAAVGEACRRCDRVCIVYVPCCDSQQTAPKPPPVMSQVPKIRAVIIADNNDPKVKGWNATVETDLGRVSGLIGLMKRNGLVGSDEIINSKDVTKENILYAIRSIRVGPNDTLFVYYNGHGKQDKARENEAEKGHYLDLLLNKNDAPETRLYRSEIVAAMKERGARLNVLITDSCAAQEQEDPVAELGPKTKFKGESTTEVEKYKNEILMQLFMNQQGWVDINSCDMGEVAVAEVFTPTFVTEAKEWDLAISPTPSWQIFFDQVKKETAKKFKEVVEDKGYVLGSEAKPQKTQTPIAFSIEVSPWYDSTDRKAATSEREEAASLKPATLQVQVPESAKLFIDNVATQQTTAARTFQTPALAPGWDYKYTLRAQVSVNGTSTETTREIWVSSGRTVAVDLSDPGLYQPAASLVSFKKP